MPKWHQWAKNASELLILKEADYPFPKVTPLFLGTIIQNYRIKNKKASKSFQKWIDGIGEAISNRLVPELRREHMVFSDQDYSSQTMERDFCLIKMSDFNSLIAISQACQTPIFALNPEQIKHYGNQFGVVLDTTLRSQEQFKDAFSTLADRVINLTSNAVCI